MRTGTPGQAPHVPQVHFRHLFSVKFSNLPPLCSISGPNYNCLNLSLQLGYTSGVWAGLIQFCVPQTRTGLAEQMRMSSVDGQEGMCAHPMQGHANGNSCVSLPWVVGRGPGLGIGPCRLFQSAPAGEKLVDEPFKSGQPSRAPPGNGCPHGLSSGIQSHVGTDSQECGFRV